MCGPALPLVAAGMSVLSTGIGALQANAQGKYQAKIAERNAGMEREAARLEIENTRTERLAHFRKISALKGQQRVVAAANGVSIDWGTAADLIADTDMLGREDLRRIYYRGHQRVRGHDIAASNFMGEASAQRQAAAGALAKGVFDMGSTVLGGVSQFNDLQAKRGGKPLFG